MDNNLEEKLKELRKGYIIKLKDVLLSINNLVYNEEINIEELYSKIHTISGTSGMYGLVDVSNASTEFEIYLNKIKSDINSINKIDLKERLYEFIKNLENLINKGD